MKLCEVEISFEIKVYLYKRSRVSSESAAKCAAIGECRVPPYSGHAETKVGCYFLHYPTTGHGGWVTQNQLEIH